MMSEIQIEIQELLIEGYSVEEVVSITGYREFWVQSVYEAICGV